MTQLVTERLALNPIDTADVGALHRVWTDPEVRRYLWDGRIITETQVRQIVAESKALFADLGCGLFTVCLRDTPDTVVGFCGLRRFEDSADVELRYGILPDFWGEGIVTEAARQVLCHGFDNCGLSRVFAVTDTPNQRSVRVMQRLGMSFEERREYRGLDTVFYTLSRDEYRGAE